jgi:3-hydroxyacyl-CoA dehydrogenase / enoyl-CoA hydratase / 3-hydroxybutyryl-CoA epimerase
MITSTENFHIEIDGDGILVASLCVPGRSINTITVGVIRDLEQLLGAVRAEERVRGVVLTSGRDNGFCAGADLADMEENIDRWRAAADDGELAAALKECARLGTALRGFETVGKPIVAAVNGFALGGGFEILLACHLRIVADTPAIRLALPEAGLGLLPGAGGTQRLTRLIGIEKSLPILLEGKTITAADACSLGIASAQMPAESLLGEARRLAREGVVSSASWDRKGFTLPMGGIYTPNIYPSFTMANGLLRKETSGNYPAQENILKAVYEGSLVGIDAALRIENRYFLATVRSPQAKAMVRSLFWSAQELGKGVSRPAGPPLFKVKRSAVLGAGMMGSGIAHAHALAGIDTILVDVDQSAADRGKARVAALLDKAVAARRVSPGKAAAALEHIRATDDFESIEAADIIIEAVFESREVKSDVTRRAMAGLASGGVFASNTSTLPIDGLASAATDPARFIGIHFFSPVDRMSLVEIIVGPRTTPETLAKAMDYVLSLRKTPIVVRDSRGFYTSRTFNTYLAEGLTMLAEGISPPIIDNVGRMTSMPRGPLELADDVALDLILAVGKQTAADLGTPFPARRDQQLIDTLVTRHGRCGRKNGKGIYDYPSNKGAKTLWPGLAEIAPVRITAAGSELISEIRDRLLYRQALEAARCIEEGVVTDPRHADVGALLGWGFASWTGGPLSFIDMVGPRSFVERATALTDKHGDRFTPPGILLDMAKRDQRFYGD